MPQHQDYALLLALVTGSVILAFGLDFAFLLRRKLKQAGTLTFSIIVAVFVSVCVWRQPIHFVYRPPAVADIVGAVCSVSIWAMFGAHVWTRESRMGRAIHRFPRPGNWELIWGGRLVMLASIVVFVFSLQVNTWQGCLDSVLLVTFGYYLARHLGQAEIRENGIRWWGIFRPWAQLRKFEWTVGTPARLRLSAASRATLDIRIDCDRDDEIADILVEHGLKPH